MDAATEAKYNRVFSPLSSSSPTLIAVVALLVVCVLVMIAYFIWQHRDTVRWRQMIFRLAIDRAANQSTRTVASPDRQGRFQPAVWCRTCNDYVDHLENMCPHVGKKFYFSVLHR